MKITTCTVYQLKNDTAKVYKHGEDDYSVYFVNAECSVRGTYADVMQEIEDARKAGV